MVQGEGHYALTAVKEIKVTEELIMIMMMMMMMIKVTEELVGLGQDVTHCQTEEFRADCLSRKYREQVVTHI